ncbi:hypothetical protein, partial [Cryobacterium sp. MLB-32]|uniref:hypothetical protein n=1 Tax=Cryobacterium sp. MLB-32 TaxID=1529318 RepID=UPI001E59715D
LNRPSRQALITQLQDLLRFDLPYHYRYSFHRVALTWWEELFRWGSTTPVVGLNDAGHVAEQWGSTAPQVVPTEANIQPCNR